MTFGPDAVPAASYDRHMPANDLLPVIVPVVLLQLALLLLGLRDLRRPDRRVRGGSKPLWAIVVIFIGVIGPLVYFLAGREEA